MRTSFAVLALVLISSARAQSPVPRQATELTITQPEGTRTLLSSFRGKVVVIQFLATTCQHCQRLSQALTLMSTQLGPDVQMIGIAFDNADAAATRGYVDAFKIGFPVGYTDRNAAFGYLGLTELQRIGVPQLVVIDRRGRIRAQTDALGGGELGDPALLRALIGDLLREP